MVGFSTYTNLHLKHRHNPLPGCDALNDTAGKIFYNITESIYDSFECSKHFIFESAFSDFLPDLFDWIHFRRIGWNEAEGYIIRDFQTFRLMPASTVADQENLVIWIVFRQFFQEEIHADCITIGQYPKEAVAGSRFNSPIGITIFPNVMAGCGRALAFSTPASLGVVNSSETRLILKHYSYILAGILADDFVVLRLNFFEESCSSSDAALGCFGRGITFRHPCRCNTRYT